jgi:protein tyrosine kinase modulator
MPMRVWRVVVAASILAVFVLGYGLHQPLKYETSAEILLGQKPPPSDCYQGICLLPNAPEDDTSFTVAVAKAIPTKPVARAVVKQLKLPKESTGKVLENISAEQEPGTAFIDISYTDRDPRRAKQVTNTLAKVSSERISEVAPVSRRITATLWEPAKLPAAPVSPNPIRNGLITLAIGVALSLLVVTLREYRRDNHQRFP